MQDTPQTQNEIVGKNVATYRDALGISQAQLAKRLAERLGKKSVDPTTITRLESGKRPTTIDELAALADVFEVDIPTLLRPPAITQDYLMLSRYITQLRDYRARNRSLEQRITHHLELIANILQAHPEMRSQLPARDQQFLSEIERPF